MRGIFRVCHKETDMEGTMEDTGYTTGITEWAVRAEYAMLNKSVDRAEPMEFTLHYIISAREVQEAWDVAMAAFPMQLTFGSRIFGREAMTVRIE